MLLYFGFWCISHPNLPLYLGFVFVYFTHIFKVIYFTQNLPQSLGIFIHFTAIPTTIFGLFIYFIRTPTTIFGLFSSISQPSRPLYFDFFIQFTTESPLYIFLLLIYQAYLPLLYLGFFTHKPTTIFGFFNPFYTSPFAQLRCHIRVGAVERVRTVAMFVIGAALIAVNRLLGTCNKANRATN